MPNPIPSEVLTISKGENCASIEASTLEGNHWIDKGSATIRVTSRRTGRVESFTYSHDLRDREGEIYASIFRPKTWKLRESGFHIIVWNT